MQIQQQDQDLDLDLGCASFLMGPHPNLPSAPASMYCASSGTSLDAAQRLLMACMRSSRWHISYKHPAAADEVAIVTVLCHLRPHELMLRSVLGSGSGSLCWVIRKYD